MTASINPLIETADAVELLHADHERIRHLFREFERAYAHRSHRQAQVIARRVCRELEIHATVEEEIFYAEMRGMLEDVALINAAKEEHALAARLIGEITAGPVLDSACAAQLRELRESIEKHMREEEQQMFSRVRPAELDMCEIGTRIKARKLDLQLGLSAGADRMSSVSRRRAHFPALRASGC